MANTGGDGESQSAVARTVAELSGIRARITTLSLASGLPVPVWSELCSLDTELAAAIGRLAPIVDLAERIAREWRDQDGITGELLDQLADVVEVTDGE